MLAPMSGYTDSSFRQLVKEICPRVICFTEFTNTDGLLHKSGSSLRQISFNAEKERPIIAQIFGKRPENFAAAAKILTELGVDAIDINMGCPARKVVNSDTGSALFKNPTLAGEIVAAVCKSTHLPVSVKTRIGIAAYDAEKFFEFGKIIEKAGAKSLTVHGRTSKQMYGGAADFAPIYAIKKLLKIPVIGNGDIRNGSDAVNKLGNLDGVMVGRGSFGNPWIFAEIAAAFDDKPYEAPDRAEKLATIRHHLELSCEFKGEKWGILEMRKHFAWYIRGFPNASELRQKFVNVASKEEANSLLEQFFPLQ